MAEEKVKKIRYLVKCMNETCSNYNQELNESAETCSLCGEPVSKTETKANPTLGLVAMFAGIGAAIFCFFAMDWWMLFAGFVVNPISVVLGFISRTKVGIVGSLIGLAAFAGAFIRFLTF